MSDFGAQISIIVYPISTVPSRKTWQNPAPRHRSWHSAAPPAQRPGCSAGSSAGRSHRRRSDAPQPAAARAASAGMRPGNQHTTAKNMANVTCFFWVTHDSMIISSLFPALSSLYLLSEIAWHANRVRVPPTVSTAFFPLLLPHLFCLKGSTASLAIAIGGEETWKIFMLPSLPWRLLKGQ